ncbi:hypothetical protein [Pseudomonas sp. TMP9]|jgi:hypothetical protein|uniref:hypothetical protein n=1 Tax=Pseudomonas sp. TMP9 TaxID=3133144 RepID=UPI0030D09581
MSTPAKRYDTLVICGANSNEVPREAAGGEVIAWSAGHAIAEYGPLEEFVSGLADGEWYSDVEAIATEAQRVLELSRRQRDHGWLNNEEKNNG